MTSRRSSGSILAESAVEPTRSENITVTCRHSAVSSGAAEATAAVAAFVALFASLGSSAIARSNRRR